MEADPWQEKPHIQVTGTVAALADMKTGKGPGGCQATVGMWQHLLVQLKLKVSIQFDRYPAMLLHVPA